MDEVIYDIPDNVNPLLLYGQHDTHLKYIEQSIPVRLIARGHQLKIIGEPADADLVKMIFDDLIHALEVKKQLNRDDIQTAVQIALPVSRQEEKTAAPETAGDDILLLSNEGAVRARSAGQQELIQSLRKHDIIFAIGPAGTGKTYLAVAMAVQQLRSQIVRKIILTRPAVEAGESLGFLPGDFKEKVNPYLKPLYDALDEMLPRELLRRYLDQEVIEILPLAYMRGRTLNNAFVILDEAQNTTFTQMKMFLTRLGHHSKAVITGDITQIDLPDKKHSGLVSSIKVLSDIGGIAFIHLDKNDVVRHQLVKDIIEAYDKFSNGS